MDVNSLVMTVFSGLSALVVEDVVDGGDAVVVTARTWEDAVPCPGCGTSSAKVHGYHRRTVADVPVDGRPVVVRLRVRRLVCPVLVCRRQTFREQIAGLLERHQRRTVRLAWQISQVARELCGRAGARLAGLLAVPVSRSTALRHLQRLPMPRQAVPRVIGVDDFALRRRHRYATINPSRPGGVHEQTTRERWNKVHDLLSQGVGLLDCSRRLGVALNTVKRYARMPEPQALRIAPAYRPTLVDPYRDHLRARRAADPAVPVTHLLREIRELGYTGSANLLVRYLNQGRAEGDRPVTTPRHTSRLLLTNPENLRPRETTLLERIAAACPEMTALADLVRGFAALLKPAAGNDVRLTEWIAAARAVDLPHLRSLTNGLEIDRPAVDAGLTLPYHNGRTEGINTRTKRIMRQMHGRAGFDLLRHRILLP